MDFLTIIGVLVAIGGILLGQFLDGGNLASIIQLTAFCIVIGGTTGAVMIQYKLPVFVRSLKMLPWVLKAPAIDPQPLIEQLVEWSHTARKNGLLALEGSLDSVADPFLRKGLQMLVDGTEPQKIRDTLLVELEAREAIERQAAKVLNLREATRPPSVFSAPSLDSFTSWKILPIRPSSVPASPPPSLPPSTVSARPISFFCRYPTKSKGSSTNAVIYGK